MISRKRIEQSTLRRRGQVLPLLLTFTFIISSSITLWFILFAGKTSPQLPPDHENVVTGDRMYMAAKLSLKDPNGSPASGAILTMNNQQVVANEQGVAWF